MAGHISIAPWSVYTEASHSYYGPPQRAACVGVLDLRSNTQCGRLDARDPGYGFFVYRDRAVIPGGRYLGSDPQRQLSLADRSALETFLGLPPRTLLESSLLSVLRELFLAYADPAGETAWKPLRTSRRRGMRLYLGGYGWLLREGFSPSHPAFALTLEVCQADYRRHRQGGVPLEALRRWTGYNMLKLYGYTGDDLLPGLAPPEHQPDGWLPPRTTLGDTFVESIDTSLESHTPTGPNAGTGWAMVEGPAAGLVVLASTDVVQRRNQTANTRHAYRTADALSGDDHYAQAVASNLVGGGGAVRFTAVAARLSSSAATGYYGGFHRASDLADPYTINKLVTGAVTELASTTATGDDADPNTIKLEVNGSDLDLYAVNGATLRVSVSDTAITGNLYAGISGSHTGNDRNRWDDFEAADLAAPPPGFPHSQAVIIG